MEDLKAALVVPPNWTNVFKDSLDLRLCTVAYQEDESSPPLVVTRSVVVSSTNRTWRVHVHGHLLDPSAVPLLADIPSTLDSSTTSLLLQRLGELNICIGNPEANFIAIGRSKKNGQFLSADKIIVAYLDSNACVTVDGQEYPVTVRCSKCHLLTERVRCQECLRYRKILLAHHSRAVRDLPAQKSKRVNYRLVYEIIYTLCAC